MRIINKNAKGICFAVDKSNCLKGTVTDGDIRRALLNDVRLDEKIGNIVSNEFCYASINDKYNSLIEKITNEIKIVPLVDENFKVVDIFEYKQNFIFL